MRKEDQKSQAREQAASRKVYHRPSFRHEKIFETIALACGKINPTQGACHANRKNS